MTKTHFKKALLKPGARKFRRVMNEYAKGKLYTSHGTKVENPKQAAAIAYSEAKIHQSLSEKRSHVFDACPTCIATHKNVPWKYEK